MGPGSRTAVVLTLALVFAAAGRADDRLVVLGHRVWRVDPEGRRNVRRGERPADAMGSRSAPRFPRGARRQPEAISHA
jgi:hypothetical protein